MSYFQGLKIRTKMLLMTVLPLLLAVVLSIVFIINLDSKAGAMADIELLTKVEVKASSLVHNLQRERGMSSGYINSKGTKFSQELLGQREETDKTALEYQAELMEIDESLINPKLKAKLNLIEENLNKLSSFRSGVDNFSVAGGMSLKFYTDFIGSIISISDNIIELSASDIQLLNMLQGYKAMMNLKERNGILRAVLSGVLAKQYFEDDTYRKTIEVLSELNVFEKEFFSFSSEDLIDDYKNKANFEQVNEIIKYVFDNKKDTLTKYNANQWFEVISNKIDILRDIEEKAADKILKRADESVSNAQYIEYIFIGIIIIVLTLTFFIVIKIANKISTRLKTATYLAEQISKGNVKVFNELEA